MYNTVFQTCDRILNYGSKQKKDEENQHKQKCAHKMNTNKQNEPGPTAKRFDLFREWRWFMCVESREQTCTDSYFRSEYKMKIGKGLA